MGRREGRFVTVVELAKSERLQIRFACAWLGLAWSLRLDSTRETSRQSNSRHDCLTQHHLCLDITCWNTIKSHVCQMRHRLIARNSNFLYLVSRELTMIQKGPFEHSRMAFSCAVGTAYADR